MIMIMRERERGKEIKSQLAAYKFSLYTLSVYVICIQFICIQQSGGSGLGLIRELHQDPDPVSEWAGIRIQDQFFLGSRIRIQKPNNNVMIIIYSFSNHCIRIFEFQLLNKRYTYIFFISCEKKKWSSNKQKLLRQGIKNKGSSGILKCEKKNL